MTTTVDKSARAADDAQFFTPEQLSANQSFTPEGFLLCTNVPIARTGEMLYAKGELVNDQGDEAVEDKDGWIIVSRGPEDLFRPETLASFEGKPVTDGHPPGFVTPENYGKYAVGTTHNVRRGEGPYADCIVADLLITSAKAIQQVQDGEREISCGYDAEYTQSEPGRGAQSNIVGNHNALVERGRCGPRCSIKDEEPTMAKKTWRERLMGAFRANDEEAVKKIADELEEGDGDQHVHLHLEKAEDKTKDEPPEDPTEARFKKIEDALEKLTKDRTRDEEVAPKGDESDGTATTGDDDEDGDGDKGKASKAGDEDDDDDDREGTHDTFQGVYAMAEILSPGIKLKKPTADAKADRKAFRDALCACKREALAKAYVTDAGKQAVDAVLAGRKPTFDSMACGALDAVFNGATAIMKLQNKDSAHQRTADGLPTNRPRSSAEVNQANAEFWEKRGVRQL